MPLPLPTRRTCETGRMTKRKVCIITSRNISSWVCPVDFDGRREMSSLSLKTVVVHKSVTSLVMETNLRKGRLVHRVPNTKSREKLSELFQSVCVSFCKYKHCNLFNLFFCPFKQRDMSVMTRVPNFIL